MLAISCSAASYFLLLLLSLWEVPSSSLEFPTQMTFRGAVLHAPPFATVVEHEDGSVEYGGLQVDMLERMKVFAAQDNVDLQIELSPAPPQYGPAFDLVANDCNTTVNPNPKEDCDLYDVIIANFYATPARSLRTDLSPGWLRSTISTIKFLGKSEDSIDYTTMKQASAAGATVCLKDGTFYAGVVKEKFPGAQYYFCFSQDDCLTALKNEQCVLYASDELQLRHRAALDNTLQVTPESFNTQYIVWAIKDNTPNVRFFKKWVYDCITNSTMDELYFKFFQKELCPVGTAGEKCELPCDPDHGKADARGVCVCTSSKFTGDDCSVEVPEDLNLIPKSLKILAWVLFGINLLTIIACSAWLYWKRSSTQVRMSQPFFLGLILLGCLISSSTIIAMAQEDEGSGPVPACIAIPWLYSVGFSVTFGTLFAKIRRVYLIFKSAADMRRQMVTFQETLAITGVVLLLDILILIIWTIVDPLHWERTVTSADQFGQPLSSEGHCTSDHWEWWTGSIAILHLGLLGFACYLCYVSRDIPTKFSEGKYVSISMFSNLQIFVVGVPILVILGTDPEASFFIRSVVIWMNDFMVVTLIFGNLIYHVHFSGNDKRSVGEAIGTAIASFSNRQKERSSRASMRHSRYSQSSSGFDPDVLAEIKEASKETSGDSRYDAASEFKTDDKPEQNPEPSSLARTSWAGLEYLSSCESQLVDCSLDLRETTIFEEEEEDAPESSMSLKGGDNSESTAERRSSGKTDETEGTESGSSN